MSTSKVSGKLRGTEGTWVGPNPGEIAIVGSTSLGAPNSTTYGAFGSSHPAGALFLFFDGEVRPIGANVDAKTFDALATTSGDDIVGDF